MGIEEQIDRLIDLGEDIKSRLDRLIEQGVMLKQPVGGRFVLPPESEMNSITFGEAIKKAKNHFADANKIVADALKSDGCISSSAVSDEPAKEPSLDGLPDLRTFAQPNLRWRILEPGEVVCSSDWVNAKSNLPSDPPNGLGWRPAIVSAGLTVLKHDGCVYARLVADEPAKEPEPEYREPMLPADAGKECEVSDDGKTWVGGKVYGWRVAPHSWWAWGRWYRFARIKVDA